jgi:hypothetical protein
VADDLAINGGHKHRRRIYDHETDYVGFVVIAHTVTK